MSLHFFFFFIVFSVLGGRRYRFLREMMMHSPICAWRRLHPAKERNSTFIICQVSGDKRSRISNEGCPGACLSLHTIEPNKTQCSVCHWRSEAWTENDLFSRSALHLTIFRRFEVLRKTTASSTESCLRQFRRELEATCAHWSPGWSPKCYSFAFF